MTGAPLATSRVNRSASSTLDTMVKLRWCCDSDSLAVVTMNGVLSLFLWCDSCLNIKLMHSFTVEETKTRYSLILDGEMTLKGRHVTASKADRA